MEEKVVATNRQAHYNYTILESFEAGIELKGTEVKSLRAGQTNLKDSFARVDNGEIFLYNMHIAPYEFGNIANVDPIRPRKLLLHKNQIRRLIGDLAAKRLTLIPLKLYFKHGIAKVELAIAKGKKLYDKRETIRRRETERELRRITRGKI
ncbi:MAG: SsrA-binding protein SmpB [Candidatus Omnitrophica bacterium]|nr:SsrA-binding protein SmpB [Candidatus Omnitrophota bacterium]